MIVTMTQTEEYSVNSGATRQHFQAGRCYDVPDDVGCAMVSAGHAVEIVLPAVMTPELPKKTGKKRGE